MVFLVAACSAGGSPSAPSAAPTPGESSAVSTASPTTDPAGAGAGPPCRVKLPASWRQAITSVPHAPAESVDAALVTPDGTSYQVTSTRAGSQEFGWHRGTESGTVQDFRRHPEWQVLAPTFDGRYLAYRVDKSYNNFNDFSIYVWDSTTKGAPVEVAHGERDSKGDLMGTPFVDPVVHDGWVYWTQTRDQNPGRTVLSGYRISDGHREVLSRGYGQVPVGWGNSLVWPDADKPGVATSLRMFDLGTRKRVALPAALTGVRGPSYIAGDATTLAWTTGKETEVWVYRRDWPAARLLVTEADAAEFPDVAGDVVVFQQSDAMYAADLRSWSYTKVTPEYGSISADGGPFVVIGYVPTSKDSGSEQAVLDLRTVPALGREGC
jgi:hypothetical protein